MADVKLPTYAALGLSSPKRVPADLFLLTALLAERKLANLQ